MRIAALSLHSTSGWPELGTDALAPGLHVFHGPSASGKSTVADLLTHAIYGRRFVAEAAQAAAPQGEVIVEHRDRRFRLRRSHDETAGERLTVAALDQSPVDQDTVRQLVACLSPALLRPLFAVELPRVAAARLAAVARVRPRIPRRDVAAQMGAADGRSRTAADLRPAASARNASQHLGPRHRKRRRELETAAAKTRVRTRGRRASHFLALLTDGELLRLRLGDATARARVITRDGDALAVESLWSTQRDLVYLSLCFALDLVAAAARSAAAAGARRTVCPA